MGKRLSPNQSRAFFHRQVADRSMQVVYESANIHGTVEICLVATAGHKSVLSAMHCSNTIMQAVRRGKWDNLSR